ncbi:MAG: phosphatidylglycerol lysyltransferase domain-containing protein [Syntrophobacterales bacterium]|nr:phosphatidylglycerol lysyltransferase domain-containing protein [Syntrophobacterales bacterium]
MPEVPSFPEFKSIELGDRSVFTRILKEYQPETSEWTFTNLFIWRDHYRFRWSVYGNLLIITGEQDGTGAYVMQPMGPPPRRDTALTVLKWLRKEEGVSLPTIERVDAQMIEELHGAPGLFIEPTHDHYDYVYLRDDLVQLAGNKYRTKRNRINRITRNHSFTFEPLEERHLEACLELQSNWCEVRRSEEDLSLLGEWGAIQEAMENFEALGLQGGVITIGGKVKAFSVGEMLNDATAVIHIEKANPEISELYTIINQRCAQECWNVRYINREQDLGIPGLREAKLSYHPHHMAPKYRVTLTGFE